MSLGEEHQNVQFQYNIPLLRLTLLLVFGLIEAGLNKSQILVEKQSMNVQKKEKMKKAHESTRCRTKYGTVAVAHAGFRLQVTTSFAWQIPSQSKRKSQVAPRLEASLGRSEQVDLGRWI